MSTPRSQSIQARLLDYSRKRRENHNNTLVRYGIERLLYRLSRAGTILWGGSFMKSTMCRIVMVLTISICMISSAMSESELPAGYKAIEFSEKDPVEWRRDDKSMYLLVEADFNGDGVIDEARLVLSEDDKRIVLFCFLKDKNGNITTFNLDESDISVGINYLGIREAKAGNYLTAAGKGHKSFKGDPKSIDLKNPAINLFYVESSDHFFYWDESLKNFKNVCISD